MKIAIRMDDITPDMDMVKFLRFRELCNLYQVKPLIGVVPDNQDENLHMEEAREDFWELILQLQEEGFCIAQHGCTHVYSTRNRGCFPLNAISEYAGRSYEEQLASIKKGKEILKAHGITTDIFMAPAHSYDKNTLKALKAAGFLKMTDGFGKMPYLWKGITFYPISYKQSRSLRQKKGYTTFVIHANTMQEADFERYQKIFSQNRDKLISYEEYLRVEARKRSRFGRWKEYLMAAAKHALVAVRSRHF